MNTTIERALSATLKISIHNVFYVNICYYFLIQLFDVKNNKQIRYLSKLNMSNALHYLIFIFSYRKSSEKKKKSFYYLLYNQWLIIYLVLSFF